MWIGRRIEIEGVGSNGGNDCIEPGKREPYQKINADRAKDCLRGRPFASKNSAKDNDDYKHVKDEAENYVDDGMRPDIGVEEHCVFHHGRDGKGQREKDQPLPEANGVNTKQGDDYAKGAKYVVACAQCVADVRVENQVCEKEEKQYKELAASDERQPPPERRKMGRR